MTLAGPLAEGRTARAAGQTAAVTEKGTDYLGRIDCYHDIEYISWRVWTKKKEEEAKKAEEEQRRADEWRLVLVNSEHSLPEDYPVTRAKTEDGQYVDERIAKELAAMLDAAKEDGIDIRVISGYRSYKRQVSLYERRAGAGIRAAG